MGHHLQLISINYEIIFYAVAIKNFLLHLTIPKLRSHTQNKKKKKIPLKQDKGEITFQPETQKQNSNRVNKPKRPEKRSLFNGLQPLTLYKKKRQKRERKNRTQHLTSERKSFVPRKNGRALLCLSKPPENSLSKRGKKKKQITFLMNCPELTLCVPASII